MPLFRDNPVRSAVSLALALAGAYVLTTFMNSIEAFHMTQTSVAILALAALMFLCVFWSFVPTEGGLTQTQEEMLLIGGFGLFWAAIVLAWRGFTHTGGRTTAASSTGRSVGTRARKPGTRYAYGSGQPKPYPCHPDDIYCVVEEYTYW